MSNMFLVVGSKGGSGATTLCVDLAKATARIGAATSIVDADLSGRRSLADLLEGTHTLDAQRSRSVFAIARIQDLNVIELLDRYDNVFALKTSDLEPIAEKLAASDGIVFVDIPRPFGDKVRPFVQKASRVILVVEPNMLGVASGQRQIGDLARFGIPPQRVWILINLRSGRSEISVRELERTLGASVIGEIPKRQERGFGRAIETLAKRLLEVPQEEPFQNLRGSMFSNATTATPAPIEAAVSANGAVPVVSSSKREEQENRRRSEERTKLKNEISTEMSKRVDVVAASRAHTDGEKFSELRQQIGQVLGELLSEHDDISMQDRAELQQELIDEQLGLGPLEDLMRDEGVSEIMVNGPDHVYVERGGKLTLSGAAFKDEQHLRTVIERIVAPLGRRIDESSPMVDARLPDGSRVNAIIPPLALNGSTLTIRRFSKKRLLMEDLVRFNSVPAEAVGLLRAMVESRLNIVVSGGTGSGKTTFLNILSNFIPTTDRILTIEDAAELSLPQEHVVRLESRPPNVEGKGAVTIRDLVKNSLRMRPDRIVVGECRGGEALDMLQAMNTGHDGSLTTLHANTPRDALARLETLVLMAGFDLPIRAIREQVASAVDAIVQIERLRDGTRKCVSITEVVGMEGDIVTTQELVRFHHEGLDTTGKVAGHFQFTGVQPQHMARFEESGVDFNLSELSTLQPVGSAW